MPRIVGVNGTQLTLLATVYAGDAPTSLTIHNNLLSGTALLLAVK